MKPFIPGLVSVSLRQRSPEEILQLCAELGLLGIEWGGDIHVPSGDLETAQRVGFLTRAHGLSVTAYGSYYRVGISEAAGLSFASVADTAVALGAPVIRVWAGSQASAKMDAAAREALYQDARRIARIAQARDLTVAFEYHGGTLTDDRESTAALLAATTPDGLQTLWQPPIGWNDVECEAALLEAAPHLSHVHVFQWLADGTRRPLAEGETRWRRFLEILSALDRPVPLLLEFVENDDPANVRRDAATLLSWIP